MITIIVAMDQNRLIGQDGHLPWHIKEDLQHFKRETINKTLLMGRKTYESLKGPLPNREHIVLSSNIEFGKQHPEVKVISSLQKVIDEYKDSQKELMVIGGASVYAQVFPFADKVVLSIINGIYQGDTYLPIFENDFMVESIQDMEVFKIIRYRR